MDFKPLSICTYNVHNFHKKAVRPLKFKFLQDLLDSHTFLCIQEHWLYESNIENVIGGLKPGCNVIGCSPMNESVQRRGRPYGGCAIVWESSADFKADKVSCSNKRVLALEVSLKSGVTILLVNVYMPYNDNRPESLVDYREVVNDVNQLISERDPDEVVFLGDMNASFAGVSPLVRERCGIIAELRDTFDLQCISDHIPMTFCDTEGRNSAVDHCFVSERLYSKLISCDIIDNFIHSDHAPVSMSFDFNIPFLAEEARVFVSRTAWYKATAQDLGEYSSALLDRLNRIDLSCDALRCTDVHCKEHGQELVDMYDYVIRSHLECADEYIPKTGGASSEPNNSNGSSNVPGWNEFVKDLYEESLFWHSAWIHQGRPHEGDFFEARKLARARYHLAVRRCKSDEDKIRMERMAEALVANNSRNFWLEAKKIKGGSRSFPRKVDEAQCQEDIADLFKEKYSALYNSVSYESEDYEELQRQVEADIQPGTTFVFAASSILKELKSLKGGKDGGPEVVSSDHIINGPVVKLAEVLALLFTAMLIHGVCPPSLAAGTLSPIPKCKKKSAESSDNWRQIALSSILGKVADKVFLSEESSNLVSTDLQFAYKAGFSTSQCTFNLMETITYYNQKKTSVYLVLLDASRAFDRVNLVKLFHEIRQRGVNPLIVRFLMAMYARQSLNVRWRNVQTSFFATTNGVRQGGVHSPLLFTVYMDGLFRRLSRTGMGCFMGSMFLGCLGYADDVALLAPTLPALERLISVSFQYARDFDILFNGSKSKFLVFRHAEDASGAFSIQIGADKVNETQSDVHLGHKLDSNALVESLVKDAKGQFWASYNKLLSHFGSVRPDLRCRLFSAYCTSYYGSSLWHHRFYREIAIAWRTALKRTWDLPRETHRVLVPLVSLTMPLEVSLLKRFCKFAQMGLFGPSHVTGYVMRLVRGNPLSTFNANANFLRGIYALDIEECVSVDFDTFFRDGWNAGVPDVVKDIGSELRELLMMRTAQPSVDGAIPLLYEWEREELIGIMSTE